MAEYKGRKVQLNKIMPGDVKKFKVYVRDPKTGTIKKVNFGARGYKIKRGDPEHRKAYRKRHHCDDPNVKKPITSAEYWSCRNWEKPKSNDLDKKRGFDRAALHRALDYVLDRIAEKKQGRKG